MSIAQAKHEFPTRYYRWCMAEIVEEFAVGFPLARRIRYSYALRRPAMLARIGPDEGLKLVKAYMRRGVAKEILGEDLSSDEQALLSRAREMLAQSISPEESEFRRRRYAGDPSTRIPRRKLMAAVEAAVGSLFSGGKPYYQHEEGARYRAKIRSCEVDANFDFGGYARQMEVMFKLAWPGQPLRMASPLSPLPCLGGDGACWNNHYRDEVEEMASTAADLCRYVLNFVPKLLEGLDVKPDEPPPPNPEVVPVDLDRKLPLFDSRGEESDGR